ncbi:LysM peptidoglycan-binding domain-containing protein [Nocardioides psychrotolerans]|uniref:LysM peptidoglycan-binding domain-containing protein n=1 Tax=Nocardioides psychrotolerans TaxID=1005945 RepID=UPI0031379AB7
MSTMTLHPTAATHPPTLRLTRRGRLVVFLGSLLVVLAVGFVLASGSVATERPGTPEPTRVVLVGPGDTLWDLAADLADDGDVRSMMAEITRLNALDSGMVSVGQELRVPTS